VLKDRAELTQAWKTIRQQNADLARLKRVEGAMVVVSIVPICGRVDAYSSAPCLALPWELLHKHCTTPIFAD